MKDTPQQQSPTFRRRIIMIKRGLQMKYVVLVFATVVLTALIVSVDTYYIIGKTVLQHLGEAELAPLMKAAMRLLAIHMSLYLLIILICSIFISHKFAGPIFRLERVSESLAQGDLTVKVTFRQGDEFFETAEYMNRMIASLREKVSKDRNLSERVLEKLKDCSQKLEQNRVTPAEAAQLLEEIAVEVGHISSDFKI